MSRALFVEPDFEEGATGPEFLGELPHPRKFSAPLQGVKDVLEVRADRQTASKSRPSSTHKDVVQVAVEIRLPVVLEAEAPIFFVTAAPREIPGAH